VAALHVYATPINRAGRYTTLPDVTALTCQNLARQHAASVGFGVTVRPNEASTRQTCRTPRPRPPACKSSVSSESCGSSWAGSRPYVTVWYRH
jgi:hypothetical protein